MAAPADNDNLFQFPHELLIASSWVSAEDCHFYSAQASVTKYGFS